MAASSERESPGGAACEKQATWSIRRILLRWFLRGAVFLVVVLVAGFVWDQMASRGFETKYPPPGQKVRLPDERNLHFVISGEGEPTLVFQSGAGGPHTDWAAVIDKLAETTRVVAYDRRDRPLHWIIECPDGWGFSFIVPDEVPLELARELVGSTFARCIDVHNLDASPPAELTTAERLRWEVYCNGLIVRMPVPADVSGNLAELLAGGEILGIQPIAGRLKR